MAEAAARKVMVRVTDPAGVLEPQRERRNYSVVFAVGLLHVTRIDGVPVVDLVKINGPRV
jgi:hypothetical protein